MQNCVYEFGDSIYINLTNECSNSCDFCIRNFKDGVGGSDLWLEHEPSASEVIDALGKFDLSRYDGAVFCGFGEPTIRIDALCEIGRELKRRGATVRLNTNGQANMIHRRDVSAELAEAVDKINVSLNEATAEEYAKLCKPAFGEAAFEGLQEFAKRCAARGIDTWFSVVDVIGAEKIAKCREIAKNCGVALRVREYIADSE